jgi:hypothetical protein
LRLYWPDEASRHVDLNLAQGLDWWGRGIGADQMWAAWCRNGRIITSLYDTWTLYSWSEWLSRQPVLPSHVTVLHVDDHRDMASPRLFIRDDTWHDAITGQPVHMNRPAEIEAAIRSGSLGMGSFMTPFVHHVPHVDIRHLCQPPKTTETKCYSVKRTTEGDTLLDLQSLRPALELVSPNDSDSRYLVTNSVKDWLTGVGDGTILLHIDMDYFSNRYDGDSDWQTHVALDPTLAEIFSKCDELTAALQDSGLATQIEDIAISYSPGFFPAEYWRDVDVRLRKGLEALDGK